MKKECRGVDSVTDGLTSADITRIEAPRPRISEVNSCPLALPSSSGIGSLLVYCELGNRVRNGTPLVHAVEDALAALQWTNPLGPFTRTAARQYLLDSCCREHRREAEKLLSNGRMAS